MLLKRKSSLILSVFGVAYIQNVLSKFNSFLAALIIKSGIFQININRKMKNFNFMPPHKPLNIYINNCVSKTA